MNRRCETCMWWDTSVQRSALPDPDTTGLCRRHTPPAVDDRTGAALWPSTTDEDWCGEHEPITPEEVTP